MKITNWRTRIEDKLAWKKIVEQAKTHPPWVVKLIKKKKKIVGIAALDIPIYISFSGAVSISDCVWHRCYS
jgi:hypothetical protein